MNNNVHSHNTPNVWRKALAALTVCLTLYCCTGSEKSQYSNISPDGWRYGDTLALQPTLYNAADSAQAKGDLSVVIRHSNSYEYSNLWLRIDRYAPDTILTDTVNIILADDYGNWLGKGLGMSFQQSQEVLKDVEMDLTHPIKVSHIMRADTLEGIEQVGIVFKAKP